MERWKGEISVSHPSQRTRRMGRIPREEQMLLPAVTAWGTHPSMGGGDRDLRRQLGTWAGKTYLSGFYETAVECKGIPLVFVLLGVFVFAVAFACWDDTDLEEDSSRTSIRTRGESPRTRCLMVSDEDELGLLSKARPLKAKPLSAVTQTRDGFVVNNSVLFLVLLVRGGVRRP